MLGMAAGSLGLGPGDTPRDGFLDSVAETLDVGERTGAPVQIAHHKVVGQHNWGAVARSLKLVLKILLFGPW